MNDYIKRTRKEIRQLLSKELIAAAQEAQISSDPWPEQLAWLIEYMLTSDDDVPVSVMAEEFIEFVETADW